MKIDSIEYSNFKELEAKLNTLIVMYANDKKDISVADLKDFICAQDIGEREKVHLAISAMATIGRHNLTDKK